MSGLSTVEILRGAKTVLERNGLHKGSLFDWEQGDAGTPVAECRMCLIGAINFADSGDPLAGTDLKAYNIVRELLGGDITAVSVWNDAPERTLPEVLAVFEAAIERAEAVSGA